MDVGQTASFIQAMTYEAGLLEYEDFPITSEPVYILGKRYSAIHEQEELKHDFYSRLWFTYRRGFAPIGSVNGPTGDSGWGCMLRCGQMMLAQALVIKHLGTDWRWCPGKYEPNYFEILRLFLDKKGSTYSIHQIANMGASEGKQIGEWFGPNTIAQVLKKLVVYDDWSDVVLHVALDNTVIIEDLSAMCKSESSSVSWKKQSPDSATCQHCKQKQEQVAAPVLNNVRRRNKTKLEACDNHPLNSGVNGVETSEQSSEQCDMNSSDLCSCGGRWRPLVLVIPLRLGLSEINPVYSSALKTCLTFPQSIGIIGGKPNHAHYFLGYVEDQLLYLDPHTTQYYTDVTKPDQTDESYHCDYISRMRITQLDPSIALGFFCDSESSFTDLCQRIRKDIIEREKTPMFELHNKRPPHWPSFEPYSPEGATGVDFTMLDNAERQFDTDEEFELL